MTETEERKTCDDCEHFDTMAGNIYGVCIEQSFIEDADDGWYLEWMYHLSPICELFKEVQP